MEVNIKNLFLFFYGRVTTYSGLKYYLNTFK